MSDGAPGDLDGELRRIKSEIRAESTIKSWERWLGLKNLAGTENIAFTFVSATQFTVNDNFTGSGRVESVVGRKFVAYGPGHAYMGGGIITAASWSSPNTTVTVFMIDNPLDVSLVEIQFGVYPFAAPGPTILSTYAYLVGPIITLGSNLWYNCPGGPALATAFTLALKQWPIPRAGILRNLFVQQLAAGAAPVVNVTIYINGVVPSSPIFCSVSGAPAQASDTTNCLYVNAGDLLTFEFANQSGTIASGHLLASIELH